MANALINQERGLSVARRPPGTSNGKGTISSSGTACRVTG
jgi:hypothetical protein